MAQKDKVKELVGRGLGSYHTKALQQMDRIEKKNKEQNHKISILSNELDNDYLTKTEEGSVISLEHSKEGMVYLDELQGNTLVNYCTDGSKELTLNGDIDVEGTFVTTTEGVDNGKVDVVCEGNTLVNLIKNNGAFTVTKTAEQSYCQYDVPLVYPLKANKTYTIYLTVKSNAYDHLPFSNIVIGQGNHDNWSYRLYWERDFGKNRLDKGIGRHKLTFTTHSRVEESSHKWIKFIFEEFAEFNTTIKDIVLLEGEHNEDIDNFIGMKSVGQNDVDGHKIEILSQNKNLIDVTNGSVKYSYIIDKTTNSITDTSNNTNYKDFQLYVYLKANKIYKLSHSNESTHNLNESNTQLLKGKCVGYNGNLLVGNLKSDKTLPTVESDGWYSIHCHSLNNNNNLINLQLEEGTQSTDYISYSLNKKEISLNEPLRGLPSGSKDKIIKISGKYFIERNIRQKLLTGADSEKWLIHSDSDENVIEFRCNTGSPSIVSNSGSTISDKFIGKSGGNIDRIAWAGDTVYITISRNKLATVDVAGLRQWLSNNNVLVQNQLATPIYEPLEVEPTLLTYNDVTHISNNSIIPCTMKIKNTGYNAIIKPSTLYTVAIGTDKGGTIGMSLGGTKVTTTNNVAKITTPATLTDDSLRLYGKGRKGSKIRILEGDIVNIPKHFTGIQSSFEDKVQTDGSYKVEVLSNNENLFRLEDIKYSTSAGNSARPIKNGFKIITDTVNYWHAVVSMELNVKPKTTYTLGVSKKVVINAYPSQEPSWGAGYVFIREYGDKVLTEGKVKDNTRTYFRFNSGENTKIRVTFSTATDVTTQKGEYDFTDLDLRESKSNLEYVDNKYNKIQFSSIEPLRSVNKNIRDKFIFKDGKLMIERNCIQANLTRELPWSLNKTIPSSNGVQFVCRPFSGWGNCKPKETEIICSKKPTLQNDGGNHSIWVYDKSTIVLQMNNGLIKSVNDLSDWLDEEKPVVVVPLVEPTYEEIPFELQKIILEGYENGTLFFDTNIPPTSTVTYAGETPIVKATKLNKTEVLNNTEDINDNIIPYLMDMDYRVVCLQLATEEIEGGVSMARLFGGAYEMLKRDILSKRLTREEYGYRLADYFNAGKLTEQEVRELEELR